MKVSREIYLKRAELAQARWNLDQIHARQAEAMDVVERLTGELIDLILATSSNPPEVE